MSRTPRYWGNFIEDTPQLCGCGSAMEKVSRNVGKGHVKEWLKCKSLTCGVRKSMLFLREYVTEL